MPQSPRAAAVFSGCSKVGGLGEQNCEGRSLFTQTEVLMISSGVIRGEISTELGADFCHSFYYQNIKPTLCQDGILVLVQT